MNKTSIYLFTVLTFGMVSNINAQNSSKMETQFNEEQKKVYNVIAGMTDAFVRKDIDGVLSSYEDDAIVMFEPQVPIAGKENLRMGFTQFMSMNPKFTYSGHEVYLSGDIATHIAPWHMTGSMPDGTEVELSGLSIAVLRKQKDGTWLMIQDNPNGQFLMNK